MGNQSQAPLPDSSLGPSSVFPVQPAQPVRETRAIPIVPSRPKRPLYFFLILGLVLLVLVGGGYLLKSQREVGIGQPSPFLGQPSVTPVPEEPGYFKTADWLSSGTKVASSGESIVFFSQLDANWLHFESRKEGAWSEIQGDFEISFRIALGEKTSGNNPHGGIEFYSDFDPQKRNVLTLMADRQNSSFTLSEDIRKEAKFRLIEEKEMPVSGRFKLRFKGVGSGEKEKITLSDGETNEILVETQLSAVFFPQGSQLGIGFQIGDGVEFLTVSEVEVVE